MQGLWFNVVLPGDVDSSPGWIQKKIPQKLTCDAMRMAMFHSGTHDTGFFLSYNGVQSCRDFSSRERLPPGADPGECNLSDTVYLLEVGALGDIVHYGFLVDDA